MVERDGAEDRGSVRLWPLVALAVGRVIWPATWWWSQLRGAAVVKEEDGDDAR